MIYNIKSGAWESHFDPTPTYKPTYKPTAGTELPRPTTTPIIKKSNAALIGGIVGGVVAIALIAGLILCLRKRKVVLMRNTRPNDGNGSSDDGSRPNAIFMSQNNSDHIWTPSAMVAPPPLDAVDKNQDHSEYSFDQQYGQEKQYAQQHHDNQYSVVPKHSWPSPPEHKAIITPPSSTHASTTVGSPQLFTNDNYVSPTSTHACGKYPHKRDRPLNTVQSTDFLFIPPPPEPRGPQACNWPG